MAVGHYKQLRMYGHAVELRREVFALSKKWPGEERYALTDQIRRSSRPVGANVAEAWCKRRYERHFISKLTDALEEAEETAVWLDVASECGYMEQEDYEMLSTVRRQVCGGLVKVMAEPAKWCGPTRLVREALEDYHFAL